MSQGDTFVKDRAGFPMLWCEEVGAYVHWLPVTKIQFEYFLCAAPDAYFDAAWYDQVLGLNPRVSPWGVAADNYWGALLTGVRPSEAQRFASWCGDGYRLPTEDQWSDLFHALGNKPAVKEPASLLLESCSDRVRELLQRLDATARQVAERMRSGPSLASQMLLRFGVMEWVRVGSPPTTWSTKGEPIPDFCGNLAVLERPAEPLATDPESSRFASAGFRLLWSPSARASGDLAIENVPPTDSPSNGG